MKSLTQPLAVYAAAVLAISACAFLPAQAMAQSRVDVSIVVNNAPPAPRFESVPAPRRGYVWAPGYWNWDGHHHVWNGGVWVRERGGNQYRSPVWVQQGNGWRLDRGGWVTVQPQAVAYEEIAIAPPPPRFERAPHPRYGYVWAPGHWEWRARSYAWSPGAWIAERPGYVYAAPVWNQRGGHWRMEEGRWSPRG
ncbi:MAG: hypothetical protein RLZZ237_3980 [Pseudomonadota bacterium]